jgi:hypothetical protein
LAGRRAKLSSVWRHNDWLWGQVFDHLCRPQGYLKLNVYADFHEYSISPLTVFEDFIYSGTYNEQVYITRGSIKIYGQTNVAGNYSGNSKSLFLDKSAGLSAMRVAVTITHNLDAGTAGSLRDMAS